MFGIILGVAAILAIGITNQTALDAVTNLFQETAGKSNLIITSNEADGKGFSENAYQKIKSYQGIQSAVPSIHLTTLLVTGETPSQLDLSFFGTDTGGLSIYGIDPTIDGEVREYSLTEGKFLSPDLNGEEIVMVEDFAKENELEVGKFVEIVAETGIEKLRVVGLIAKEGAGQLNNGSFAIIPIKTAQRLFYRDGELDQIDLIAAPANAGAVELDALRLSLQASLGRKYSVVYPASQGRRMTDMLSNYQIGLNFLSGMALFVGAFLIFNSFQMTVVERTREFGMLRTVGMTRAQVTRQVLFEATFLGITGSLLGVGLGILLSRGLTSLMETLLAQDMASVDIPQNTVITGVSVGIIVAIFAALFPAVQAGRISPLEALRVRSQVKEGCLTRFGWVPGSLLIGVSVFFLVVNPFSYDTQFSMGSMAVVLLFLGGTLLIPVSVGLWEFVLRPFARLLFGRTGQIGSSNIRRSRQRTTLTVAALMIGIAMIIVVWAMTLSFKGDLDEWLEGYIGGDLYVTSNIAMGTDVWRRLESVNGVAAATPSRYFEVEWQPPGLGDEKIMYRAVDPASYNRVTSFVFSAAEPDEQTAMQSLAEGDAVFISSVIAEKYDLGPGDKVVLVTHLGKKAFDVAGVVVDYYNQGLVINGNWSDMWRYFRQQDANTYMVKVEEGYTPNQVADQIDALYGKRDRLVIISNQQLLGQVSGLLDQAFSMFDILAIISMVVGFLGIANTLTMNVMERTQEIGMLRAVGMTRGQVVRMILSEAAIMGMIGGILGVGFGIVLSKIFMQAMTAMSGYNLTYILPTSRILIALVIAFVISQLAAFLPALRAARIHVLEAIHYE